MTLARAAIFDLDGVLADTARLHLAAWQRLAREEGFELPPDAHERLKGVDRMASLTIVLEGTTHVYSEAERTALADRKNRYYREQLGTITPRDLLPGADALLKRLTSWQVPVALASASRNAREVIEGLDIAECFDFIADAAAVSQPKPAPDIFLLAAEGLGVPPEVCVGIEDAAAGITAIHRAGMYAIGVGDAQILCEADCVVSDLTHFDPEPYFRARR